MRAPSKKSLVMNALSQLNDFHVYIEEVRFHEGNREARAAEMYRPTVQSMSTHIETIKLFNPDLLPEWLTKNEAYYKSIGWM